MALLPILVYPDPRLHTIAQPVREVNARIRSLVKDMFETMYQVHGIGLAATQVNVHERLIVLDVSEQRDRPMVLINPELVEASSERKKSEEGCLSVPGVYDQVERAERITVRALDEQGQARLVPAQGLLAVCIQHEMDHLMGRVFVEYLSPLKRQRIQTKMRKLERAAAR